MRLGCPRARAAWHRTSGWMVVGLASGTGDPRGAVELLLPGLEPDVPGLMDLQMPDVDGVEASRRSVRGGFRSPRAWS